MTETPARPRRQSSRGARIAYGVVGVVGELLITLGVLLFGFLVWQLWWTDVQGNRAQAEVVRELVRETPPAPTAGATDSVKIAEPRHDAPPVLEEQSHATTFATMQVPRWDGEPERPISEGTDRATVLDVLGVGHYEGTAMPGDVGNFAVAGHRTTYAKPFNRVAELKKGDPVVVRTSTLDGSAGTDTWYVYRVVSTQIVAPTDVQVIAPVPNEPDEQPTKRMMTMTTCHPMFSARERYIVHLELDYWAPVSSGTPAELVGSTTAKGR
ncbi:class E sortase [Cellulomonas sp. PhB150]|uniref:class E sortase n=1 Tax=Cellulomonas sp. PhB150 TaxID=2485188 RepID=UPI000F472706|nr:class E sortase [Cellulomonas sp. PhB150]ROS26210.1 sortase A [Cellulomonas sp. PhB150]